MFAGALKKFIGHESSSGIMLMVAAALALALDNSPLSWLYDSLLTTPVAVQIGAFKLDKPLLLWTNDGLMAVFFLLVGLEIKREILRGQLASRDQVILPGLAALGGMAIPALIFLAVTWRHPDLSAGWAIPAATDIAFALGVLALLGRQLGIFGPVWLTVGAGLARLPEGVSWSQIYGVACVAGIGFTMSLFIGTLAFADLTSAAGVRIGVLSGSFFSALVGYWVLRLVAAPAAGHGEDRSASAATAHGKPHWSFAKGATPLVPTGRQNPGEPRKE